MRYLVYVGVAHFVVELPDGDRLLLPAWMTEAAAAMPPMMATPRLSLTCLRELRRLVDLQDVSLSPANEAIRNDGGMMEQRAQERQLDLLMLAADDVAPRLFDLATRAQIVTLLKVLLSDRLALVSMPAETDDD